MGIISAVRTVAGVIKMPCCRRVDSRGIYINYAPLFSM